MSMTVEAAPGTPAPAASPAPGTPAPAAKPWHDGMPAEHLGIISNRGWDKLDAAGAAKAIVASYDEAQRKLGVPANELLRFKPDDPAIMDGFFQRLGVPKDAKDYDLSAIKFKDGSALDDTFADRVRAAALKFHLPKEAAAGMAAELAAFVDEQEAADAQVETSQIEAGRAAVKKNWGQNYEQNRLIAQRAAQAMGFDAEIISTLEKAAGYEKVMGALLAVGQKIGEDKLLVMDTPAGRGVITREGAVAEKKKLMADPTFASRATEKN